MKMLSKEGNTLHKRVMIRIFDVGNKTAVTQRFVAVSGKGYSEEAIEKMLEACAENLEQRRPNDEYEIVQVDSASFNFVWRGSRVPDASQEPAEA